MYVQKQLLATHTSDGLCTLSTFLAASKRWCPLTHINTKRALASRVGRQEILVRVVEGKSDVAAAVRLSTRIADYASQ